MQRHWLCVSLSGLQIVIPDKLTDAFVDITERYLLETVVKTLEWVLDTPIVMPNFVDPIPENQ